RHGNAGGFESASWSLTIGQIDVEALLNGDLKEAHSFVEELFDKDIEPGLCLLVYALSYPSWLQIGSDNGSGSGFVVFDADDYLASCGVGKACGGLRQN